jgi:hypothetical protein
MLRGRSGPVVLFLALTSGRYLEEAAEEDDAVGLFVSLFLELTLGIFGLTLSLLEWLFEICRFDVLPVVDVMYVALCII